MRISTIIMHVLAVSVFSASLGGCAKKEDRSKGEFDANAASNSQSSTAARQVVQPGEMTSQTSTPELPAEPEKDVARDVEGGLQKQIDEVRRAFVSLQEVCKANDVDGYLAFWDDETKKAIDGRDLNLEERRERRRESLAKRPGALEEIANATIESIAVDTSQAEKLATLGVQIEGTMMLVRTNGPALLFHETAQGWKLFTRAPGEYFR